MRAGIVFGLFTAVSQQVFGRLGCIVNGNPGEISALTLMPMSEMLRVSHFGLSIGSSSSCCM